MIYIPSTISTEKVIEAIKLLTGLVPYEQISENRYALILGTKRPLEVGYDKNKKLLKEEEMKTSASIKMVEIIGQMMQNESGFIIWIENNINHEKRNINN